MVSSLKVSGFDILPKEKAKNLGFMFDNQLSQDQQLVAINYKSYKTLLLDLFLDLKAKLSMPTTYFLIPQKTPLSTCALSY